jgi:hypothetical protein
MRFYARVVAAWSLLAVVMVANGIFRGLVLEPHLGHHIARQVSSVLGGGIVVAVAGLFVLRLPDAGSGSLRTKMPAALTTMKAPSTDAAWRPAWCPRDGSRTSPRKNPLATMTAARSSHAPAAFA